MKARFIGSKGDLKQRIGRVEGFPFYSYIGDDGLPVLFANDEEQKKALFAECEQMGIEIV